MHNLWWYAVKQALVKKLFMTLSMRIWRWNRCVNTRSWPDAATQTEWTFFVKYQPYTIKDTEDFFARLVTDSKSWLHYHTLDNKRWSVQWEHPESSNSFIHSFIPLACADCDNSLLFSGASSIPLCYLLFPATPLHRFICPLSPHFAIYFLVYLSILLFPNSYIILFWKFYFLPFSVHVQTNVTYLTLLSLL